MKLSLEEAQDKRKLRKTISVIKSQIEYILWLLSNTTTGVSSNTTTITSTVSVTIVETLPPIPESGYQMVFWTSVDAGVGDDQTWEAFAGQSRWYPCQFPTSLNGTPGT